MRPGPWRASASKPRSLYLFWVDQLELDTPSSTGTYHWPGPRVWPEGAGWMLSPNFATLFQALPNNEGILTILYMYVSVQSK